MIDPIPSINSTAIVAEASTLLFQRVEWLYSILKGIGVLLVLYLLYLGFYAYIQRKMRRRVKKIEEMLTEVDKKLDILLKVVSKSGRSVSKATKKG